MKKHNPSLPKNEKLNTRTKAELKTRHELEAGGGAAGAIAGAAFGSIAGPPGIAAGAVIGAIAGAIVGAATDSESMAHSVRDEKLDLEIGVSGGDLGAPNLKHPPATVGAYSGASVGGSAHESSPPSEGPLQAPED